MKKQMVMKKLCYYLFVVACLLLCSCNSNSTDTKIHKSVGGDENGSMVSEYTLQIIDSTDSASSTDGFEKQNESNEAIQPQLSLESNNIIVKLHTDEILQIGDRYHSNNLKYLMKYLRRNEK